MKRPVKLPSSQFTLSLNQQQPSPLASSSKEELLNALADLLREALSAGPKPNEARKEPADESQNHA